MAVEDPPLVSEARLEATRLAYSELRSMSNFFNNNDFIPTAELDYCTEVDQPFLNVLLRGNSQLARQA